ncbi:MAG: hypothetical protein GY744_03290 [Gammaproteobacteria bacterium]|nr:hypothetical protein [Gammaproteobacteria bacterium]
MAMITNIQHFMDGDEVVEDLPTEAQQLLNFLTAIIEAATETYDDTIPAATVCACRNATNCDGDIVAWVSHEDDRIHWGCTDCDDEGVITDWEGTPWDKRNYTRH